MSIKLNGATNGSIQLDVPAAIGSDLNVTLPATAGEIVVANTSGDVDLGTGDLSADRGTFSTRARAVSGNSYAEISHADGLTMVDSNLTKANITLDGSATFARFVSSPAISCEPANRYATNTASFKQPADATNADVVLRLQHEGANDGYLLLGGGSGFTTPSNSTVSIRADGSAYFNASVAGDGEKVRIVVTSGSKPALRCDHLVASSGARVMLSSLPSQGNDTSSAHFQGNTSGINNWYLYGNGTSSYSSDERLKKNIETTRDGYLEDIQKLRVVKYNWQNQEDGAPRELGLIAQEVEEVFPALVQDDLYPLSEDDPTIYKQLKGSVIPMILLKALQEAGARIEALEAEVQALKGGNS